MKRCFGFCIAAVLLLVLGFVAGSVTNVWLFPPIRFNDIETIESVHSTVYDVEPSEVELLAAAERGLTLAGHQAELWRPRSSLRARDGDRFVVRDTNPISGERVYHVVYDCDGARRTITVRLRMGLAKVIVANPR